MTRLALRRLLPALCTVAALAARSQGVSRTDPAPDPLDPRADVPRLVHHSSLARYRSLVDAKPLAWRDANDGVGRIGGWRAYAREASAPEPSPADKAAPAPAAQGDPRTR